MSDTTGLTVLGKTVQHSIEHVEVFPAPKNISSVTNQVTFALNQRA